MDDNVGIKINKVSKKFSEKILFDDFSLEIPKEQITAILGPNGSGKSTLMNMIVGIEKTDSGTIQTNANDISYVFQNYRESLLPWKTCRENIALPLLLRGTQSKEIAERIDELCQIFTPTFSLDQFPYELSGGQQQVLAMMRALITRPDLLLIDEPFSALDYQNNLQLRLHLLVYHQKYQPTILLITHNIEEAAHVSDSILVLRAHPTSVHETLTTNLGKGRSIETLTTPEFHQTKDRALTSFQEAVCL